MPIKKRAGYVPPVAKPAEPSFLDRLGGWRGVAGGATRAISGVMSAEGGLPGAGISGLGEGAAELIEGSDFSPARIATESALGAVPFGAVLKAGRPLASAVRGGIYSGVGEGMREKARGEDLNPGAIATHTGIGSVLTGGLAKLFGGVSTKAPKLPDVEIEPTIRPGGRVLSGSSKGPKTFESTGVRAIPASGQDIELPYGPPPPPSNTGVPIVGTPAEASGRVQKVITKEEAAAAKVEKAALAQAQYDEALKGKVAQPASVSDSYSTDIPGGKGRVSIKHTIPDEEEEAVAGELGEVLGVTKPAGKRMKSAPPIGTRAGDIYDQWRGLGKDHKTALNLATKDLPPTEHALSRGAGHVDTPPVSQVAPVIEEAVGVEPAVTAPVVEEATSPLAKVLGVKKARPSKVERFNSQVGKIVEGAERPPELPPFEPPTTPTPLNPIEDVPAIERPFVEGLEPVQPPRAEVVAPTSLSPKDAAIAHAKATFPDEVNTTLDQLATQGGKGREMAEIRDFMSGKKMREGWKGAPEFGPELPPNFQPPTQGAEVAEEAPGWVQEQLNSLKDYATRHDVKVLPPDKPGGTTLGAGLGGAADVASLIQKYPQLAARLGLGAAGALVGGATDPLGNPLLSAAAGGIAGAALPSLPAALKSVGVHPDILEGHDLSSAEGIHNAAAHIYKRLPQWQRFSLLTDIKGIGQNAIMGPYGSALMGALEHGLSGDPRGWAAIKNLSPKEFMKVYWDSLNEARSLVGRAEGTAMSAATNDFDKAMAAPGVYMTAGDITARKFLMDAGFTSDEARRITLTSEPELRSFKQMANFGKGSPFLQMLLPFRRTPANIGEQGMERMPGLGFLVQNARERAGGVADPLNQQLVQQGLSLGAGGVGFAAGNTLDPDSESTKVIRRGLSNVAGQYSLPTSIGFAAGQSMRKGKPILSPQTIGTAVDALPLPTTQTVTEWFNLLAGNSNKPPHGVLPTNIQDLLFPGGSGSNSVKSISGIKRKR